MYVLFCNSLIVVLSVYFYYRAMLCTTRTMSLQYVRPSVRLFVCPSVETRRYSIETVKHMIKHFHHWVASHTSIVFTARCYASAVYAFMQCPSVCLSVYLSVRLSRSWITSKRINISSKFFHHLVATRF